MKTKMIVSVVVLLTLTACQMGDGVDEVDAGLSEPVYLVTTLSMSGPCATDDRFTPPEVITIATHVGGVASVTLDFGEVVELSWTAKKGGGTAMGGTPYTGSQWALLGGAFANGMGSVSWDGPIGVCTQSVQITRSR